MNHHILFGPGDKMADVLQSNYRLLPLLPRFGLTLGTGEKTVEQVCREKGVDCRLLLLVFNIYTHPDYLPSEKEISSFPVEKLLDYLYESHQYYRNDKIPHIQKHLEKIVESYPKANGRVLRDFFRQYADEVAQHLDYEENTVFPYIRSLLGGKKENKYNISVFEKNHTNIEEKLSDLAHIIIKYLPPATDGREENEILFDLYILGDDIARHTLIEDKVLVPLAELQESKAK